MSNKIKELFERKSDILSIYFTAGFPKLTDTMVVLKELQNAGVDLVEIGIPFSDPLADGPIIQKSSEIALKNGMSLNVLFEQIKNVRKEISIPVILMGYLNPILQYGIESFVMKCKEIGVDGVIIPDLPLDEFVNDYKNLFMENNMKNIFLITPQTSEERIRKIDSESEGFIYMVSSAATTGKGLEMNNAREYFSRIKGLKLKNPLLVGFGIYNKESYNFACSFSNGAIIGSAFIKVIEKEGNLIDNIRGFIKEIK